MADVLHLEVGPVCAVVKESSPEGDVLEVSAPDERIVAIHFARARERLRAGGTLTTPTGTGFALALDREEVGRIVEGGRFSRPAARTLATPRRA